MGIQFVPRGIQPLSGALTPGAKAINRAAATRIYPGIPAQFIAIFFWLKRGKAASMGWRKRTFVGMR